MEQHIADLLIHPKVLETQEHMHHSIPKHDHLLRSVKYSSRSNSDILEAEAVWAN